MSFAVVFAVVLVAALAIIFMRRRIPSRITVSSPRLGFLNLKGPVAHELLEQKGFDLAVSLFEQPTVVVIRFGDAKELVE